MTTSDWTCACGVVNPKVRRKCEHCGEFRPATDTPRGQLPSRCWYDGGELDALGFCMRGQGFPVDLKCPFVCPFCRSPLSWSGGCDACKGTPTPKLHDTWTIPGTRYETHADDGKPIGDGCHWIKTEAAGRPGSTDLEAEVFAKTLVDMLRRSMLAHLTDRLRAP